MTGKVISLGQVIVDLTMNVDAVPRAGEDVFAGNVQTQVGASFNTLYAVRRMGVKASHAGVIGTGPWASQILQTLENQEIQHIGKRDAVHDSGFCVALPTRMLNGRSFRRGAQKRTAVPMRSIL